MRRDGPVRRFLDPSLNLKEIIMTTCESISTVLARYSSTPRESLPGWLRDANPRDEERFNLAFALASHSHGIRPVCQDGILVGWEGIGFRVREQKPKTQPWNLN